MAVIGFGFNQVVAERNKPVTGKISINNNVAIKEVKTQELNLGEGQKAIIFGFQFASDFAPDIGRIALKGEVSYMFDAEKAKHVLDTWEKDKKVPSEVLPGVLSYILGKCNVEAIAISRDVALPPPMPMPKVEPKK